MKLLKKYLSKTFSSTFFPIFFTLFAITSVVYLVKIASLTSVITISFKELLFLYSLTIPQILYYTLPITFFISMVLNLSKLSSEYELIVITSFGLSPLKILRLITPLSLLVSVVLFIISFILIPQADRTQEIFINKKKQEAQFNIKPNEYGQKFGPWYIYVEKKVKNKYSNITLYQIKDNTNRFIMASYAYIKTDANALTLELYNGSSSTISSYIQQIDFEKMTMTNYIKRTKRLSSLTDIVKYWKQTTPHSSRLRIFIKNIFITLLPILSVLFYIVFGYYNPRYETNKAIIYSIGLVIIYITSMLQIADHKDLKVIWIMPVVWIIFSIILYIKKIRRFY